MQPLANILIFKTLRAGRQPCQLKDGVTKGRKGPKLLVEHRLSLAVVKRKRIEFFSWSSALEAKC